MLPWSTGLLGTVLLAMSLPGQEVKTILDNGPTENRYDLVILGDGYTEGEQGDFDKDARNVSAALFEEEPYKTLAGYFNVHTVFRASVESGADHPDADPPVYRDTAYGARYDTGGTGRCLYIANTSLALRDASLAPAVEGRMIVLVNDSRYGGCAGGVFSVSYNGSLMTEVQIHELGHSFGGLADEYSTLEDTYTGPEPIEKNVTTSPTGNKWSQWHGYDGIGAYEGARYYPYGLYRPRMSCLMRSLASDNCAVCIEQLVLRTYRTVIPLEQASPVETSLVLDVARSQLFSIQSLIPASGKSTITWKLDGEVKATDSTTYVLDPATSRLGKHTVEVELRDETGLVRRDPSGLLTSTHSWSVQIVDPTLPDVVVRSVQGPLSVPPGEIMTITTVVENIGLIGAAGSFTLEHFLSSDDDLTTDDIYLGSHTVSGLAPGQSEVVVRTDVRIPIRAHSRVWYLWAQLDRDDQVVENGEENNAQRTITLVSGPNCGPYLEYMDPLLYPHDSAAIDAVPGGVVLPTVIAPCAPPGTRYLIVWGCSDTQPGTLLPPGVTVPINEDECTALGLLNPNTPVFASFYGELDSSGSGKATFEWPPGVAPRNIAGHFAAMLFDGSGGISSASNPVEILIRL